MSCSDESGFYSGKKKESLSNATDRRTAWKNSSTVKASGKDSLLTNSGDDRFSNSLDLRLDGKAGKNHHTPCMKLEKDSGNKLRVPSPTKKYGFYSSSPSTDEGIGGDEQTPDAFKFKSENNRVLSKSNFDDLISQTNFVSTCEENINSSSFASSQAFEKMKHEKQNLNYGNSRKEIALESNSSKCHRGENEKRFPQARKNKQVWRQASDASPASSQQLSRDNASRERWSAIASCCELNRGECRTEDGPVLVYNKALDEVRSRKPRMSALFERHETEIVTRNGIPISRILSKSVDETYDDSHGNNFESEMLSAHRSTPALKHNSNGEGVKVEVEPLCLEMTDFSPIEHEHKKNSLTSGNSNSIRNLESRKNSPSAHPEKQKARVPRSGSDFQSRKSSSRKSTIAGALSASIAASAAGSLVGESTLLPANDKQRSLAERLMWVGMSDQRRVQGIVEDILCEMGEERIVQYKDAFRKFDKDSRGTISSKQLRSLLRTLGHNPSDTELRELVNQVDMDENGKIDFNEFIIMIGYFDKANNEDEDLLNIFRVFDRDGRNCIDVVELRNIWDNFWKGHIPDDSFEEMLSVVDDDENGEINRMELLELLRTR